MEMSAAVLRDLCMQHKLYRTPGLNDKLYLNFKGFTRIACLEGYTALKALFLEGNALASLAGLPPLQELTCLYVQHNCLRSLEGLEAVPNLNTLNVSANVLSSLAELASCSSLATLIAERNHLSTAEALSPLLLCTGLHTLDLQNNNIEDVAVVDDIIAQLPALRCLYLTGNPVVSKIPSYRKALIARCSALTYLDDRPVSDEERAWCQAWASGGVEAERAERTRLKEEAASKERRNFEWLQQLRREGFRKRRAMLGLPDGDTDPYLDTLPDQECRASRTHPGDSDDESGDGGGNSSSSDAELPSDASEDESYLLEPPELVAARQRLAAHQAGISAADGEPQEQPAPAASAAADAKEAPGAEWGSSEDGVAYLCSVKENQQELDAVGSARLPPAPTPPAAAAAACAWLGDDAATDGRLASLRSANQAALAAIGMAEVPLALPGSADSDVTTLSCITTADPDGDDSMLPALEQQPPAADLGAAAEGRSTTGTRGSSSPAAAGAVAAEDVTLQVVASAYEQQQQQPAPVRGKVVMRSLYDLE